MCVAVPGAERVDPHEARCQVKRVCIVPGVRDMGRGVGRSGGIAPTIKSSPDKSRCRAGNFVSYPLIRWRYLVTGQFIQSLIYSS